MSSQVFSLNAVQVMTRLFSFTLPSAYTVGMSGGEIKASNEKMQGINNDLKNKSPSQISAFENNVNFILMAAKTASPAARLQALYYIRLIAQRPEKGGEVINQWNQWFQKQTLSEHKKTAESDKKAAIVNAKMLTGAAAASKKEIAVTAQATQKIQAEQNKARKAELEAQKKLIVSAAKLEQQAEKAQTQQQKIAIQSEKALIHKTLDKAKDDAAQAERQRKIEMEAYRSREKIASMEAKQELMSQEQTRASGVYGEASSGYNPNLGIWFRNMSNKQQNETIAYFRDLDKKLRTLPPEARPVFENANALMTQNLINEEPGHKVYLAAILRNIAGNPFKADTFIRDFFKKVKRAAPQAALVMPEGGATVADTHISVSEGGSQALIITPAAGAEYTVTAGQGIASDSVVAPAGTLSTDYLMPTYQPAATTPIDIYSPSGNTIQPATLDYGYAMPSAATQSLPFSSGSMAFNDTAFNLPVPDYSTVPVKSDAGSGGSQQFAPELVAVVEPEKPKSGIAMLLIPLALLAPFLM